MILRTSSRKNSVLNNVQFVANLAHNLLSVGDQLMASGYKVQFADGECSLRDAHTDSLVARVHMTPRCLFPLEADDVDSAHVVQGEGDISNLWHKRYWHLSQINLNYFSEHHLVVGLQAIKPIEEPC